MKDWTGNSKSVYVTHGANNHSDSERETNDYYATDPRAVEMLLQKLGRLPDKVWEPATGGGHIAEVLKRRGYEVVCSDLIQRNYPLDFQTDFLQMTEAPEGVNTIITNPPYKYATEFVLKSIELLPERGILLMLLKTTFLEGARRWTRIYSKYPPLYMYQFVNRVDCPKNGDFDGYACSKAISYAWFLWRKGSWTHAPRIKWLTDREE